MIETPCCAAAWAPIQWPSLVESTAGILQIKPRGSRQTMPRGLNSAARSFVQASSVMSVVSLRVSEASPAARKKKVPALAIRSLPRAKGNRDKTTRIHVVGIHSAVPEPQSQTPSRPARCNLRRRITTFNPRARRIAGAGGAYSSLRAVQPIIDAALTKHLSTMPPTCLSPIRSGPLAKDRNSLVCPTNVCRYLRLHEKVGWRNDTPVDQIPLPCFCIA